MVKEEKRCLNCGVSIEDIEYDGVFCLSECETEWEETHPDD